MVNILQIYGFQIITLYIVSVYSVVCQLQLKAVNKKKKYVDECVCILLGPLPGPWRGALQRRPPKCKLPVAFGDSGFGCDH